MMSSESHIEEYDSPLKLVGRQSRLLMCGTNIAYMKGTTLNLYLFYHFVIILTPTTQIHCIYHLASHIKTNLVNMLHSLLIVNSFFISLNQIQKKIVLTFKMKKHYSYFDGLKIIASLIEISIIKYSYQHDLESISLKYPNIFQ